MGWPNDEARTIISNQMALFILRLESEMSKEYEAERRLLWRKTAVAYIKTVGRDKIIGGYQLEEVTKNTVRMADEMVKKFDDRFKHSSL